MRYLSYMQRRGSQWAGCHIAFQSVSQRVHLFFVTGLLFFAAIASPPAFEKVTLVGKGVCFDTGGLDIKPAAGMLTMKKDMGGGAQVGC